MKHYDRKQAAALLNISPKTVSAWRVKGWILTTSLPGGRYLISQSEIDRLSVRKFTKVVTSPVMPTVAPVLDGQMLTPYQVADIVGVTHHCVKRWGREGVIKRVVLPNGRVRIPKSEVDRLCSSRNIKEDSISPKNAIPVESPIVPDQLVLQEHADTHMADEYIKGKDVLLFVQKKPVIKSELSDEDMAMRDKIALDAMKCIVSRWPVDTKRPSKLVALSAYELADAMLEARGKVSK